MSPLLARALFVGGLLGCLDGLFGLFALGFSLKNGVAFWVVVALHQLVALVAALGTLLLLPTCGQQLSDLWTDVLATRRGAPGELGRSGLGEHGRHGGAGLGPRLLRTLGA